MTAKMNPGTMNNGTDWRNDINNDRRAFNFTCNFAAIIIGFTGIIADLGSFLIKYMQMESVYHHADFSTGTLQISG